MVNVRSSNNKSFSISSTSSTTTKNGGLLRRVLRPWHVGLCLLPLMGYLQYIAVQHSTTVPLQTAMDASSSSSLTLRMREQRRSLSANHINSDDPTTATAKNKLSIETIDKEANLFRQQQQLKRLSVPKAVAVKVEVAAAAQVEATQSAAAAAAQSAAAAAVTTAQSVTTQNQPHLQSNTKPRLVLHVGPPKTGTTSLQYMLQQYELELLKDDYYYTGNATTMSDFRLCLRRIKKAGNGPTPACWTDFVDTLEDHRLRGHNVILSNEIISWYVRREPLFWDLIQKALAPWQENVLVVVGYRHLHNFLPSTHYELEKNQRWPSSLERGKYVTPFPKFWKEQFNREEQLVGPMPTPASVIAHFSKHYQNVAVLDIETKEQISEFFCTILPGAPKTCAYHEEQKKAGTVSIPALNKNDGGQVNYDSLALVAFSKDLLKSEQTRKYLRSKVKDFNEIHLGRHFNDFPLECLNANEEQRFLQESIEHAHASGFAGQDYDEQVTASFYKTKAKKKYCTIDAMVAFREKVWYDFFHKAKTEW